MICLRTTTKHTETTSGKSRQLQFYKRPSPIFIPTRCKQSWSVMHECFVIPSAVWISAIFTFTSPRSTSSERRSKARDREIESDLYGTCHLAGSRCSSLSRWVNRRAGDDSASGRERGGAIPQ